VGVSVRRRIPPRILQIRAALRCFLLRTRSEKPHRNAKYAYLFATCSSFYVGRIGGRQVPHGEATVIRQAHSQEITACDGYPLGPKKGT
jgi:hypothetical protein